MIYHAAFSELSDGDYDEALKVFLAEAKGGIKTPQARWLDSICYEAMAGECYYQMGLLREALEHYTAAVELYVAYSDWMLRVQFEPIRAANTVVRVPWGASTRRARLGQYPAATRIGLGRINNNEQIQRGGVVQQAHFRLIEVQEIVRCTALAIRRRAALLGAVRAHDRLTSDLILALSRRPGPLNQWPEAWIHLQLGLALAAGGKEGEAVPELQTAVLAGGEFDHPLTSTALLELGRLALVRGDYPVASKYFEETTYAAVAYPDVGVLEEAFRYGALTHLLANQQGIYPLLAPAIGWAKTKNLRQLHASLLLMLAENQAMSGSTPEAKATLEEARLSIGRRQMAGGRMGGRLSFLGALVRFQQRDIAGGDQALAAAMSYMAHGSHWLFHVSLADGLYASGGASDRVAMDLYDEVLRDPQPADWAADPMEALAVLLTPHRPAFEHWFDVALKRNEHEKALEIADRARRHRFFTSLSHGGRLQSLRWVLEAPADMLDQQSQLLRRDLLVRYPAYAELVKQVSEVQQRLKAMPLVPDDQAVFREQGRVLGELASLGQQQEALLREIAVRREPAGLVFPPLRTTADIQKSLPSGCAVLAFFATSQRVYAFLLNNTQYTYWQVDSPVVTSKQMAELLRQMGNLQQNREMSTKELTDSQWKQSARNVLDSLLKGSRADFTTKFDELIIVPDGLLWYLPFEALQIEVDGQLRPLISRFRIRYVPTASLATATQRGRSPTANTAVVLGRLFPRDDNSVAEAAFERLAAAVGGSVAVKSPLPAASAVYGSLFDQLIVLDDLKLSEQDPYGWSPMPLDQGKPGGSLADWLRLPWGGPDTIILPGYHTAAEVALDQVSQTDPGAEVFLSVCGLMSCGARTLLLARWRTGGQTSVDLVREFAQELPHTTASDAWQRAVFLAAGSRLNPEAEPRVKQGIAGDLPKTNHPFFWAGYMLVDPGTPPQPADGDAIQQVAEKPEKPQ